MRELTDDALRAVRAVSDPIAVLPHAEIEARLAALHREPPRIAGLELAGAPVEGRRATSLVVDQVRLAQIERAGSGTRDRFAAQDRFAALGELAPLRGKRVAVLSGAGISVDAGFPTFRGSSAVGAGLWESIDPMQVASIEGYRRDPWRSLAWYCWRRSIGSAAVPSLAHAAIAEAERLHPARSAGVHTQNVDGMHEVAGSRGVNRIHGSIWCWREVEDGTLVFDAETDVDDIPRGPTGAPLWRPGVVMFGDCAPVGVNRRAARQLAGAEVAVVVGTAAQVSTFWPLLDAARAAGARFIEVNPEPSVVTSELGAFPVALPAGVGIPLVLEALGLLEREDLRRLARTPRATVAEALPSMAADLLGDHD